jgi:hypothetical protein
MHLIVNSDVLLNLKSCLKGARVTKRERGICIESTVTYKLVPVFTVPIHIGGFKVRYRYSIIRTFSKSCRFPIQVHIIRFVWNFYLSTKRLLVKKNTVPVLQFNSTHLTSFSPCGLSACSPPYLAGL